MEATTGYWLERFLRYLEAKRGSSSLTIQHYGSDLSQFLERMEKERILRFTDISYFHVRSFLSELNVREMRKKAWRENCQRCVPFSLPRAGRSS